MLKPSALVLLLAILAPGQQDRSPYRLAPEERARIEARAAGLAARLAGITGSDDLRADAEIYLKAARWILRHPEEFYTSAYLANTLAMLDAGMARADQLAAGKAPWADQTGRFCRAYRSRVDGSVQPYALVIPLSYDRTRPVRLDVVLHGRAATMNEVSFLAGHTSDKPVPAAQSWIQLEVFGRTNNAYRWAGETDVFEAIESVQRRYKIDPDRIVLRGFSMGGAGAWHLGLHHPDRWAAVEAGAGFVETKEYAHRSNLPAWQEAALHIYDSADYARNALLVPVVGYGGEDDPQLKASRTIRERLQAEGAPPAGLRALFLIGPKTGHRWHPETKARSDAFIDAAAARGRQVPDHIRFLTYTTTYNRAFWVTADGLERQYERAEMDARRSGGAVTLATSNIAALSLTGPAEVVIDGQKPGRGQAFEKRDGRWRAVSASDALRKRPGLQGPIDDAFRESFLCVRPRGGDPELDRFAAEFAKWMRGDVRIKDPDSVTAGDIASHHLILFGDPDTNLLIRRIAGRLPMRWSGADIVLPGERFPAAQCTLKLIYPNPLNPHRYVVLNSGHTFGEAEFRGTNALLFPRLGDWAIVRKADGAILRAGL
ncbi:MAG: prolyl oligopeptidase family serine peptidase, partial [Acidobacteria bacterium]|nr:prolyl oligopeptidase family serine peptidase [Acidobacteriota bacterium]